MDIKLSILPIAILIIYFAIFMFAENTLMSFLSGTCPEKPPAELVNKICSQVKCAEIKLDNNCSYYDICEDCNA